MAFFTINCCFDQDHFRLCLRYLLRSKVVCALVCAYPPGYMEMKLMRKVLRFFRFLPNESFLFLIRRPYEFERYQCGTDWILIGCVLFDGIRYGVMASYYMSTVHKNNDVLKLLLPTLLTGFFRLLEGGSDDDDVCIEPCDAVVILGSFLSRGYPVNNSYSWPDFSSLFPPLRVNCYGSQTRNLSCLYQPFLYNYRNQSLYFNSEKLAGSTLKKEISYVLSMFRRILSEGSGAESFLPDIQDRKLEGISAYQFISSLYNFADCDFWTQARRTIWEEASSDNFCFQSTWVQILSFDHVSEALLDNCSHFTNGLRFSSSIHDRVLESGTINEDALKVTTYNPRVLPRLPFSQNVFSPLSGSEAFGEIQRNCLLFLLSQEDYVPEPVSYTVVHFTLALALTRVAQFCQSYVGSARSHYRSGFCIFGCPFKMAHSG